VKGVLLLARVQQGFGRAIRQTAGPFLGPRNGENPIAGFASKDAKSPRHLGPYDSEAQGRLVRTAS
jgi:hypothetical protein